VFKTEKKKLLKRSRSSKKEKMVKEKTYLSEELMGRYISGIGIATRLRISYERLIEMIETTEITPRWVLEGNAKIIYIHPRDIGKLEEITHRESYL